MDYWNLLLTEAQERFSENREVAAYMGTEILGMSIPTDTTPGHLGLPERVHEKPKIGIDLILYTGGNNRDQEIALDNDQALRNRLLEIRRHGGIRIGPAGRRKQPTNIDWPEH